MKVLWFTPTPSLAESHINNSTVGGGWIKSLEKSIQDKVELSVSFYHSRKMKPFQLNNTTYYPIAPTQSTFASKLKKRIFTELESEADVDAFMEVVRTVKPDLIHIHGTEFIYGLVQRNSTIPTVVSIQGNISVYTYKFFAGMSYLSAMKFSPMAKWFAFDTYVHHYWFFRKQSRREKEIFKLSKNFIGRTDWDRRLTTLLSPKASYFINNEIMRDSFYSHEWNGSMGKQLSLFTTNGPNLYKGIETVIYCAGLLEEAGIDFKWSIAGLKPTDEVVRIACKSLDISLSPRLDFLGKISEEKLVTKLLESNIYIASSHIENSPNSLCEAQLLGLPCIATDAGGTSSLIDNNVDGILIQSGDPYVMAGAIIELSRNYEHAKTLGQNARKRALIRHDREVISSDLLNIYKEVLKNANVVKHEGNLIHSK